ncbi:actin-like ATPase domain-containing protein [Penicillium malachiteum]|uniref:actin-like ATPase domain-containing protein n=1 Tax=Penicillium malachiteum TaxID=1324776 RepID=UPI0025472031|nr:actin-like ATPase domain-containing protein [Penicillium malachiteum]KAJ5712960.1 actin-like ATPase domain-containing protein [Penicillium malachiteum]
MPTPKYDIVVGVDFGTTASAIGYSSIFLGRPYYHPKLISQSCEKPPSKKIPSVLAYIQDNPNLQENKWGFPAQKVPNVISWFKLFLDDDLEIEIKGWKAEAMGWAGPRGIMSLPTGRSSIDTISDYLGALQANIWDHLKEKFTNTEKSLETSTIKFCFTIPGHWSKEARQHMLFAIETAGFRSRKCDDICLLTEADAAIIFALSTSQDNAGTLPLKTGDGVLVCDCGGGTVDIASFVISKYNPLVYDKLAPGSGKLCGSTSVDREFYKLMEKRFGDVFSSLPWYVIGLTSEFMQDFMKVKCAFTGHGNAIFQLPLEIKVSQPFNPEWYDQNTGHVILSSADLLKLFQPSVRTIVNCLNSHMSEANSMKGEAPAIKKILLVGGFSLSRFLQSEITRAFPDMAIITDRQNALTAVVQGAIAWGSGKVELRSMRSPCHFGFSTVNLVDSSLPRSLRLGSTFQNDSINWLVKKVAFP